MESCYLELLNDIGLGLQDWHRCNDNLISVTSKKGRSKVSEIVCKKCNIKVRLVEAEPRCCGRPMQKTLEYDRVCYECGKVAEGHNREIVTPVEDYCWITDSNGTKNQPRIGKVTQIRCRAPLGNFKRVFDIYVGMVQLPPRSVVKALSRGLDHNSKDGYRQIRNKMKQNPKTRKYYSAIFAMLYAAGGPIPYRAMQHWTRIRCEYLCMHHYFSTNLPRFKRKSMPNAWMLLDYILRLLDCPAYYQLPVVENSKARSLVEQFIWAYHTEVVLKRQGIERQYYESDGIWLV